MLSMVLFKSPKGIILSETINILKYLQKQNYPLGLCI